MKRTYFILAVVSFAVTTFALDSPEDPCTDDVFRVVASFDLSTAAERAADPALTRENRTAGMTIEYHNQACLERMLTDERRETYLRESYFNGTSEAKAYALLGFHFLKSPLYSTLKEDFLRYQGSVVVVCRVTGLQAEETPAGIIKAIESGKLDAMITPRKKY